MKINKIILIMFLFATSVFTYDFSSITTEDDIYELFQEGKITEEEQSKLLYFLENPADLNKATEEQLLILPDMTQFLSEKIIKLRDEQNGFKSFSELLTIPEISSELINEWKPFITIVSIKEGFFYQKIKLQDQVNDKEHPYITNKIVINKNEFSFGFLGVYNSPDNYNFKNGIPKYFLQFEEKDLCAKIILGNYSVRFGSGLTLANNWNERDSEFYDLGIENKFYGVVVTKSIFDKLYFSYINSKKNPEVDKKYNENINGFNLQYGKQDSILDFGITYYKSIISSNEDSTYPSWYSKNNSPEAVGINLKINNKPYIYESEITRLNNESGGAIFKITSHYKDTNVFFVYRYYEKNFINPYSLSFSSSDDEPNNSDENGVFLKLNKEVNKNIFLEGYYDFWKHPSTETSASKKNVRIKTVLNKYLVLELLRTWKTDNIAENGDVNTAFKMKVQTLKILKVYITRNETKQSDYAINRNLGAKFNYKFNETSFIEYGINKYEYDVNNLNKIKLENNVQYLMNFSENGSFVFKYIIDEYNQIYEKKSEYKIKAEFQLLL